MRKEKKETSGGVDRRADVMKQLPVLSKGVRRRRQDEIHTTIQQKWVYW